MKESRTKWLWGFWITSTVVLAVLLGASMMYGGPVRALFLVGDTSDGHHQIELSCDSCHTQWFGGAEALQTGCVNCHAAELDVAKDSHPIKKFTDPRNADRLKSLNAVLCVTCHREHQPEITQAMGVTLPVDYCFACHAEVGDDRPSHKDLAFDSCASAGCHNYHDNRALYEDFLEARLHQPATVETARVKLVDWSSDGGAEVKPLTKSEADAPADRLADPVVIDDWLASSHARAGINCSGCHVAKDDVARIWLEKPGHTECASCHTTEVKSFTQGKHGMRLDAGVSMGPGDPLGLIKPARLTPMTPADARLPMKSTAHDKQLECATCHTAHGFDAARAVVEPCAACHDDAHTRNYFQSPHYKLWQAEMAGAGAPGSGVSCATCHMPLELARDADGNRIRVVNHNQNANLRPNEKMVRGVCLDCHGLDFTLDALADPASIESNFKGRPSIHVESLDWVERRLRAREASDASGAANRNE